MSVEAQAAATSAMEDVQPTSVPVVPVVPPSETLFVHNLNEKVKIEGEPIALLIFIGYLPQVSS